MSAKRLLLADNITLHRRRLPVRARAYGLPPAGLLGGIFRRMRPDTFLNLASDARRPVLEEALRIANVCGALTCTRRGDTAAMPTVQEVDEFLASNRTDSTAG